MSYARTVQEIKLTPRSIPENWTYLHALVQEDLYLNVDQKETFNQIYDGIADPDQREKTLQERSYYSYLKESLYPKLRTVKFNFYLHRKGMVKDTVHTTVIDSTYMRGVQALKDMDYESALALLRPYKDFNTAVAFMGLNRNANALNILEKHEKTPEVNYLLAILYSRTGEPEKAVDCYMRACRQNGSYVYRGNLDPEISVLIKTYGLNQEPEDDFGW
jgi:tetratricopeptide (TPR) repeat protein